MAWSILRTIRRRARGAIRRARALARYPTGNRKRKVGYLPFAVHPAIRPVPDGMLRMDPRDCLNQLCDISDWRVGHMIDLLSELREPVRIHRKAWEYGKTLAGLERLNVVRPESQGLSVGAGSERPLFYLANHIDRMVATDLYERQADNWGWSADFLRNPAKYAPFPYRGQSLEVHDMSGLELKFDDDTFDFAYTLSSIEHFGGPAAARQATRELARVVKPRGIVCIVTELQLSHGATRHPEVFTIDDLYEFIINGNGLSLVEPEIDLRISESLLVWPFHQFEESDTVSPHIVLTDKAEVPIVWTSIILFLQKQVPAPVDRAHESTHPPYGRR